MKNVYVHLAMAKDKVVNGKLGIRDAQGLKTVSCNNSSNGELTMDIAKETKEDRPLPVPLKLSMG